MSFEKGLRFCCEACVGIELDEISPARPGRINFVGEEREAGGTRKPARGDFFTGRVEEVRPEELIGGAVIKLVPFGANFIILVPAGMLFLEVFQLLKIGHR